MIYIDKNSPEIVNARKDYWQVIKCRITKKLNAKSCTNKSCIICKSTNSHSYKSTKAVEKRLKDFFFNKNNLEKLICGEPKNIFELNNDFFKYVLAKTNYNQLETYFKLTKKKKRETTIYKVINDLMDDLGKGLDYDWFTGLETNDDYSAYHLSESLNLRSCVYCNRTYTTTIRDRKKGKLMRPQFDHWYPKSYFPLLSLSFYNLIPSCYTCNSSVKGSTILNTEDHIHPYIDYSQINNFSFNYFYKRELKEYSIYLQFDENNKKAYDTLRLLKVDQMYNAHLSELSDLIKIKKAYSDTYINKIQSLFPSIKLSKNEIYRILFGTELDSEDFHKRPLSKFKSDILKKLKII